MNTAAKLSTLARAALRYAEHGWYVFPLTPREKKPVVTGGRGYLDATTDTAQIRAWWSRWPQANIGLWPGQSGLVVIDIDGPEGEATARTIGILSEPTLVCTTGRPEGGRHLYFRRPDFTVTNCSIGHKLDVRGDAGYVILPPSIHPTGTPYKWLGSADEIHAIPPNVLDILRAAKDRVSTGGTAAHENAVRDLVLADIIAEGEPGRNNTLTRYAGRLLAKGIPEDEVLILVSSLNAARCKPPLPQHEVNALVANIAAREARKRTTTSGTTIALVDRRDEQEQEQAPARQSPVEIATEQVERAKALLTRDVTAAPVWGWSDLARLAGPMLPGDFIVIGALMGNGKSSLLMSQMDAFAAARMATLYVPLEVDPEVCRLRWAAWKLELDQRHVIRQEWSKLPEGSHDAIDGLLDEQTVSPFIHFAPDKRITMASLANLCRWAKDVAGARVVMLDHLHRMDFGGDTATHRVTVTEVVRRLKDMARELGLVLIAAAQLNRSNDPLDAFIAPQLGRLKESAGIAEEADAVFMLSRRLRRQLPEQFQNKLRLQQLAEWEIEEPNTMVVTCRKHRLDNDALNRAALLHVRNGKLEDRAPSYRREPWEPA